MKNSDFNTKRNFSRAGKASAKTFSFVIDRSERLNKILKNKPHARYIEEDYFEKKDGLSLDDSKDLISEDTLEKTFKLFDIDGNGFITLDELKESMPIEITSKIEWIDLIDEVDKDGDGQISLDEFKKMMRKLIINN